MPIASPALLAFLLHGCAPGEVDDPPGDEGESVGVLEWDTRRCDGCAEVTLDSDDEGTVCW